MAVSVFFLAVAATAFVAGGYAERLTIDIGMRSYNGDMWFCQDKIDRTIPDKYKTSDQRKGQNFADLPENERPMMRKLIDGTVEPDVLDDGNSWVSFVNSKGDRIGFIVSSDGYHGDVCTKNDRVAQVEDISGKDYIVEMPFKTFDTSIEEISKIARKIGADKRIDVGSEDNTQYLYKGNDFVIELVLEVVDKYTQDYLKESSSKWPLSIQLLDYDYKKKHGQSAFTRQKIPLNSIMPKRSWLSRMQTINDKKFTARAA